MYLLFRRGFWTTQLLGALLPTRLGRFKHAADWACRRSWVVCRMFFVRPCTGAACDLCKDPRPTAPPAYHTVMAWMDEQQGARLMVDPVFEHLRAWVLLDLPDLTNDDAWRFWHERVQHATHNTLGWASNFLPRWLVRHYHGLATADDPDPRADSWFCSELATALVQQKPRYRLGLVPCRTTPQQLFDALRTAHPDLTLWRMRNKPAVDGREPITGGGTMTLRQLLVQLK